MQHHFYGKHSFAVILFCFQNLKFEKLMQIVPFVSQAVFQAEVSLFYQILAQIWNIL